MTLTVNSVSASGFRPRTLPRLTQADDRAPPPAALVRRGTSRLLCRARSRRAGALRLISRMTRPALGGEKRLASIFKVRSRARRAHHARNPNFSFARRTGDRCSRVVALSLIEGISTSSGRLQLGDRDEAPRIAANIANLPSVAAKVGWPPTVSFIDPTIVRLDLVQVALLPPERSSFWHNAAGSVLNRYE
jgi:hypothetical protein